LRRLDAPEVEAAEKGHLVERLNGSVGPMMTSGRGRQREIEADEVRPCRNDGTAAVAIGLEVKVVMNPLYE